MGCDYWWCSAGRGYRHLAYPCNQLGLFNTLKPRQTWWPLFPDDIFICIFLNENVGVLLKISPKYVPKGPINNIPALLQIMAWRRPGDKSLSETMMVSLPTNICVTRPQWVNTNHDSVCVIYISNNARSNFSTLWSPRGVCSTPQICGFWQTYWSVMDILVNAISISCSLIQAW